MINNSRSPFEAYLQHLHDLPFVQGVVVEPARPRDSKTVMTVTLFSNEGPEAMRLLVAAGSSQGDLDDLKRRRDLARSEGDLRPALAFVPRVSETVAAGLREAGINFVDRAGNCYLNLHGRYVGHVEGRAPEQEAPRPKEMRSAGYCALFALLSNPSLVATPLRHIAERAGVSTMAALDLTRRLKEEGLVVKRRGGLVIRPTRALVDRWVVGYRDIVRPHVWVGRFAMPQEREDVLVRLMNAARPGAWAWGGARADRELGGMYNAPELTLHLNIKRGARDVALPLRSDSAGPVLVLGVPGPVAWPTSEARVVHPLLVYSELRMSRDARAQDAAEALAARSRLFVEDG